MKDRYYSVGYRTIKNKYLFDDPSLIKDFTFIKNPFGRWNADPFPIIIDNKRYIFAESASIITRKGKIFYICLDDNKPKWKKAISKKYHLSFPNIFIQNNSVYMIPESHKDKAIHLFVAVEFPRKWNDEQKLISPINSVDTAWVSQNTFATYDINERIPSLVLFEKTENNYKEGKKLLDYTMTMRPAGNAVALKDKTIFVTQFNTSIYGGGLVFRYLSLDLNNFLSEPFLTITADDLKHTLNDNTICGVHTYNVFDCLEVIDLIQMKSTIHGLIHRLVKKILRK